MARLAAQACSESTRRNHLSAWTLWESFAMPRRIPLILAMDDPTRPLFMAAFQTEMSTGSIRPGDSRWTPYATGTIDNYKSSIDHLHSLATPGGIFSSVNKGIHRAAALVPDVPRVNLTLHQLCALIDSAIALNTLQELQQAFMYVLLTLSLSRSQSATLAVADSFQAGVHLAFGDVTEHFRPDGSRDAIAYPQRYLKGDYTGRRHDTGRDGHMVYVATQPGHVLDIGRLYDALIALRGRSHADAPFFQAVSKTSPHNLTGRALTYNQALQGLRSDCTRLFPGLANNARPAGLHTFRRIGATLALLSGLPDDLIMYLGAWRSNSYQRYFIFGSAAKTAITRQLYTAASGDFTMVSLRHNTSHTRDSIRARFL